MESKFNGARFGRCDDAETREKHFCPTFDEQQESDRKKRASSPVARSPYFQEGYENGFKQGRLDYEQSRLEFENTASSTSEMIWLLIGTIGLVGILSGILIAGIGIGMSIR